MTSHARDVLEDCKVAASELRDGVVGREWRIRWITTVALLRAVGHVLRKVDAPTDTLLKSIVTEEWNRLLATKPEPEIFWLFIEDERNNILKESRLSAGLDITVRPGTGHLDINAGEQWDELGLTTLYDYRMKSGPFAGIDQREVLQQALSWWDSYLGGIEQKYATSQL